MQARPVRTCVLFLLFLACEQHLAGGLRAGSSDTCAGFDKNGTLAEISSTCSGNCAPDVKTSGVYHALMIGAPLLLLVQTAVGMTMSRMTPKEYFGGIASGFGKEEEKPAEQKPAEDKDDLPAEFKEEKPADAEEQPEEVEPKAEAQAEKKLGMLERFRLTDDNLKSNVVGTYTGLNTMPIKILLEDNGMDPGLSQLLVSSLIGRGFNQFFNNMAVFGQQEWAVILSKEFLPMLGMFAVMIWMDIALVQALSNFFWACFTAGGSTIGSGVRGLFAFLAIVLGKQLFINNVQKRWLFSKDWWINSSTGKYCKKRAAITGGAFVYAGGLAAYFAAVITPFNVWWRKADCEIIYQQAQKEGEDGACSYFQTNSALSCWSFCEDQGDAVKDEPICVQSALARQCCDNFEQPKPVAWKYVVAGILLLIQQVLSIGYLFKIPFTFGFMAWKLSDHARTEVLPKAVVVYNERFNSSITTEELGYTLSRHDIEELYDVYVTRGNKGAGVATGAAADYEEVATTGTSHHASGAHARHPHRRHSHHSKHSRRAGRA